MVESSANTTVPDQKAGTSTQVFASTRPSNVDTAMTADATNEPAITTPSAMGEAADHEAVFQPSVLRVKKRHTRILGTLNKRANQEFINMMVRYGMDGVRIFKDYGQETC